LMTAFSGKKKHRDRSCTHPYTPLRSSAKTRGIGGIGLSSSFSCTQHAKLKAGLLQPMGSVPLVGSCQKTKSWAKSDRICGFPINRIGGFKRFLLALLHLIIPCECKSSPCFLLRSPSILCRNFPAPSLR
jgi:hypothetical protein